MNMFRNSLCSSLRNLGLRGYGDFGFQSKCWKFFSINNSVQFRKSDGTSTSNNLYELSEIKDKVKTRGKKNSQFHQDTYTHEEDDSFDVDSVKGNDSYPARFSSNLFGSCNFNRNVDENEDSDEEFNGDRKINENGDRNFRDHFNGNENNSLDRSMEYSYKHPYRNYSEIISVSADVPKNSAITRNIIKPPRNLYNKNIFVAKGKRFMLSAIANGVQPLRVLYCKPESLRNLNFFLNKTEFYKIDETDMRKHAHHSHFEVIGVFEKDIINKIAVTSKKELPLTVVCHKIAHRSDFNFIIDAADMGSEKFMITNGSTSCYDFITSQKCTGVLFKMPIYEGIQWSEVDESIDLDHEVFLISPREETSAANVKKKKLPAIPTADICSTDTWTKKKIFLIITCEMVEEDETLLEYCKKWRARKLILPDVNYSNALSMASPILWEIKRQYFLKNICVNNGEKEENYETY